MSDVQVNIDPVYVIEDKLGIEPNGPIQSFFTETCALHMDKYVPMRDGFLAGSERHTSDEIRYVTPYAHYMYEGKVMGPNIPIIRNGYIIGWWSKGPKEYTGKDIVYSGGMHPLATSHWAEKMWSAERDDIIKKVENEIEKRG